MRYPAEHKLESRERVVAGARDLFRRRGFDGASIDEIMQQAGLTRGAFYAHFDSKSDLIREVLEIEAGLVNRLRESTTTSDPQQAALQALTDYLDNEQHESIGCPLVAHPIDSVRGDATRKRGYTDRLQSLVANLAAVTEDEADATLVAVLAVGGAVLAAASADNELANRIADVCKRQIETTLVG